MKNTPGFDTQDSPPPPTKAPLPPLPGLEPAGPVLAPVLERALLGHRIDAAQGELLLGAGEAELPTLLAVADRLRAQAVGNRATYVVNRNINFTNICSRACGFCAFSRRSEDRDAYFLDMEEVVRRAVEARERGASEVCIQAGLAPDMPPWFHRDLLRAVKRACPELHLHACSPQEVLFGARRAGVGVEHYLGALRDAGLDSMPGTSAEILDDEVRRQLSPRRMSTSEWLAVIGAAHRLGIPTSATVMYGHLETPRQLAGHLETLRRQQEETGGFTELVPLGFVAARAPLTLRGETPGLRPGPDGAETLRLYAVARIMLNGVISNIQASWVKAGPELAVAGLKAGANDLGGTLMEESISAAAGARHGQSMTPDQLQRLARLAGRLPARRDTCYNILQTF